MHAIDGLGADVKFGDMSERRRYYAFVEAVVDALEGNNYSRGAILLDCVDAQQFSEDRPSHPVDLAYVRIVTTAAVLTHRYGLEDSPKEGDWFVIETDASVSGPLAWILSAANDYQGPPISTRLASLAPLPSDIAEFESRQLEGFSLGPLRHDASILMAFCQSRAADDSDAAEARLAFASAGLSRLQVRVVDVGQASCNAIHPVRNANSPVLAFFDVGGPIYWNRASFTNRAALKRMQVDPSCFVMLSHWDFDHYSLAYHELPQLRECRWFAPKQQVGPNAKRFQLLLGERLGFLNSPTVGLSGGAILHKGQGSATDRNGSGYVLRVDRPREPIILTGDVSYSLIPPAAIADVTALTIPHHAGPDPATPPTIGGRAVASYGVPNSYRHPCSKVVSSHNASPWTLETTAERTGIPRGDRWL